MKKLIEKFNKGNKVLSYDAPWVVEAKQKEQEDQVVYLSYLEECKQYGREPFTFELWKSTQNFLNRYQPLVNNPKIKPKDGKTLNEKALDYNKPLKGAGLRFRASMENGTNPYWGLNTMAKIVGTSGLLYTPYAAIKYGPLFLAPYLAQPHGLQNLAVSMGVDMLPGFAGGVVGGVVDRAIGGDGAVGGLLGGTAATYMLTPKINQMPWKRDLNKALHMNPPKQLDVDRVIMDLPDAFETDLYIEGNDAYMEPVPGLEKIRAKIAENHGASAYSLNNAAPNTVELHFGSPQNPPKMRGLVWAKDIATELPSGTFITPLSQALTRASRYYHDGFFSKPRLITSDRLPASTDGYRSLLQYGSKYPELFDIDFAENYVVNRWYNPLRIKPKDPTLLNLHRQAMRSLDLSDLNEYLISLGGKPAVFNKLKSLIEYPLPILIRK